MHAEVADAARLLLVNAVATAGNQWRIGVRFTLPACAHTFIESLTLAGIPIRVSGITKVPINDSAQSRWPLELYRQGPANLGRKALRWQYAVERCCGRAEPWADELRVYDLEELRAR